MLKNTWVYSIFGPVNRKNHRFLATFWKFKILIFGDPQFHFFWDRGLAMFGPFLRPFGIQKRREELKSISTDPF